jgi:anti-anti-sigma factor
VTGETEHDVVEVVLLGLPLDAHRHAAQHGAALMREFALLAAADASDDSVPTRLVALSQELSSRFAGFTAGTDTELEAALTAGRATIDLHYQVPHDAAPASTRLSELLDEADEFCRAGAHLLTLATPPDALLYRRWFLGEFVRQLSGEKPMSWRAFVDTDGAAPDGEANTDAAAPGGAAPVTISLAVELDLSSASELRTELNELLASGVVDVALDGAAVAFIDSVGVSVLMAAHARCHAAGGSLLIRNPSPRLRDTLEIVGVDDLLIG